MNILYISDCYKSCSVFSSQVHSLCNEQAKYNRVNVIAFCNQNDISEKEGEHCRYELYKVFRPPVIIFFLILGIYLKFFKFRTLFQSADVIHCRGHLAIIAAAVWLRKYNLIKPIIGDIRGVPVDEFKTRGELKDKILTLVFKAVERKAIMKSDHLFFVSNNMKEYFLKKYNIPEKKTSVFSTLVNKDYFYHDSSMRYLMREKMGISKNDTVFIYSGRMQAHQQIDLTMRSFEIALDKRQDIVLIVLTRDIKTAYDRFRNFHIPERNYRVFSAPYEEVGKYLNAADYGFLIREKTLMNFVAYPVKLNEYMQCNLKIITTISYVIDDNIVLVDLEERNISEKIVSLKKHPFNFKKYNYGDVINIAKKQESVFTEMLLSERS